MKQPETFDKVFAINVDIQNDFCEGGSLAVPDGDAVVGPMNRVNRWARERNGQVIFTRDWHPAETSHFENWPPHCIKYRAGAAFHNDLEIKDGDTIASKGQAKNDPGYSGWHASLEPDSQLYRKGNGRYDLGVHSVKEAVQEAIGIFNNRQKRVAIVIGGLATDYCVKATMLDALKEADKAQELLKSRLEESDEVVDIHGVEMPLKDALGRVGVSNLLSIYVLRDAIRAVDLQPGDGHAAINEMRQAGAKFIHSEDLLAGEILEVRQ